MKTKDQHDFNQLLPRKPNGHWYAQLPLPGLFGVKPHYTFKSRQQDREAGTGPAGVPNKTADIDNT